MPPSSASAKRPGVVAWVGFSLVAVLTIVFLKTVFWRAAGYDEMSTRTAGQSVSSKGEYGLGGAPGMNPVAPMPPQSMNDAAYDTVPREESGGSAAVDLDGNAITPRVIKTGELWLRVEDASIAMERARALVTSKEGFVESSSLTDNGSGPRTARMTLRIPVAQLDAVAAELKQSATLVLNEMMSGQDVTSDFVDLEADLRNAKAEEASYLEILKQSGDIDDVLAVTQRLAEVRGRIERYEGRKRYLENRTDLATLSVTLTEDTRIEAPTNDWRPGSVLKEAIHDLVISLQELVNFMIRLAIAIVGLLLPIALITALIVWLGWKLFRVIARRFRR
jgi:hypothetical protein